MFPASVLAARVSPEIEHQARGRCAGIALSRLAAEGVLTSEHGVRLGFSLGGPCRPTLNDTRLMEQVNALSESIPDIVMQAVGDASRALLAFVAEMAGKIAKARAELQDALAELVTLTYRVGDDVDLSGLQNLPALNGRRASAVKIFTARACWSTA